MSHPLHEPETLPAEMTAVVCSEGGGSRLETVPVPRPASGEILLRLVCCGLCGTDLHKLARGSHVGSVLGHEIVGRVVATGAGADTFRPGQRVVTPHHVPCGECRWCRTGTATRCAVFQRDLLVPGGFAEYVLVREPAVREAVRLLPDNLSSEAAVFLEPAACVLRGIDRSGLASVLAAGFEPVAVVLGGGSMGLLHLLVLRSLFPQATVVVSEPMKRRRQVARTLGASAAVAPGELPARLAELASQGADAVFDTVGSPALLEPGLALLRDGGTLILFAHFTEDSIGAVHNEIFRHERHLVGTYSGTLDEQARVYALLESGRLRPEPLVTHTLPLQRFDEAVSLATGRQGLKVLLHPG